tara:strand:+ start:5409 stop:6968 length:1560 start_codon:yes stop_codon:yes gene_type:complete
MNEKSKKYFIPIILFLISYTLYSANLDQQGIFIDEVFHHGFSIMYYDSLKNNDILNPCITGIGECTMIDLDCAGEVQWLASGGIIKGIFVGLGDDWFSDTERVYYANSETCRPIHHDQIIRGINTPTQDELEAGRFFSPIFGAMGVVVSFQIGLLLFNRFVGGIFAITLMSFSLFMLHGRILTTEIFVSFFMLFSLLLLLHAFLGKNNFQLKYLIFSGISFALALNSKIISLEILPLMILVICFSHSKEISFNSIKKIFSKRIIGLLSLFLVITIISTVATFPFYYVDPVGQFFVQLESGKNYGAWNSSIFEGKDSSLLGFLFTFSATVMPTIDMYYYMFDSENIPDSAQLGHTFTTIPLSIFSFIGFCFIIQKIRKRNFKFSEFFILAWYIPIFIFSSLITESYNITRYFLPLMFPMLLMMSYGLWRFIENTSSTKLKFYFVSLFVFSHAITYLIFWERIYLQPTIIWRLPHDINLRESLSEPIVYVSSIIFIISFIVIYFKNRRDNYFQTPQKTKIA